MVCFALLTSIAIAMPIAIFAILVFVADVDVIVFVVVPVKNYQLNSHISKN